MNPKLATLRRVVDAGVQSGPRDGEGRLMGLEPAARSAITTALGALELADFSGCEAPSPASGGWREVEVFTGDQTRASLFFVPPGVALPLHDHPGMTVFLRTLAGRLHLRSFDWVAAAGPGLARQVAVHDASPNDPPCVLLPDLGNLHAIAAQAATETAVFLDLFVPYYDDVERPCTCFREAGAVVWRGEQLVRLEVAPELDPDHAANRVPLPPS